MSTSPKETFKEIINSAIQSALDITDPAQKANAYAEIGKALAMSGLLHQQSDGISEIENLTEEEEKEIGAVSKEEEPKKVEKKKKAVKKEVEKEEPEATEEKSLGELYPEEVQFLHEVVTEYGEEEVNDVLHDFSNGLYKKIEEINAEMICSFVEHVKELAEDADEEAESA